MSTRQDWLSWRRSGIGSSDMPVVLGLSPWMTPLELWKEKTGRTPLDHEPNFAQAHGIKTEPKARAAYEILTNRDMPPETFTHPQYPFLIASLDGWNRGEKRILEIKCPLGMADHETARKGQVPEKYLWQVRHQMLVADSEVADYFSYYQPKPEMQPDKVLIEVKRDRTVERVMIEKAIQFWRCVELDLAPALTERDALELTDAKAVALCEYWKTLRHDPEAKKEIEKVRGELRLLMIHPKIKCAGVSLSMVKRGKGTVLEVRG